MAGARLRRALAARRRRPSCSWSRAATSTCSRAARPSTPASPTAAPAADLDGAPRPVGARLRPRRLRAPAPRLRRRRPRPRRGVRGETASARRARAASAAPASSAALQRAASSSRRRASSSLPTGASGSTPARSSPCPSPSIRRPKACASSSRRARRPGPRRRGARRRRLDREGRALVLRRRRPAAPQGDAARPGREDAGLVKLTLRGEAGALTLPAPGGPRDDRGAGPGRGLRVAHLERPGGARGRAAARRAAGSAAAETR